MAIPRESIFGILSPKFQYSTSEEVLLDNCEINLHSPETLKIRHESVVNKKRSYVDYGEHWKFYIKLNLFKYSDPQAKFEEIYQYKDSLVTLWAHRDRNAFKDSDGNFIPFKVAEITPAWLYSPAYPDLLYIKFESSKTPDAAQSTYITLIDDLGRELFDDVSGRHL